MYFKDLTTNKCKEIHSNLLELEFFMDVSPSWWIKARRDEKFLRNYVFEKFERDYYPRIISKGRGEIDLDKSGYMIKQSILNLLEKGDFRYEFLPEDENVKESYSITNGHVIFEPRKSKINSRILILVTMK
ncbi:MAG: hypothetical protein EA447_04100 [Nitrosopumilus sp.]|nr:MAG: hypothetical protein EA447_04100 [Nitrosopumilus sp.]